MDVVLDASVEREADPDNLAPTASATVALSLGHALAVALMRARNFGVEDFERFHPGGHLGRSLRLTVREVMHGRDEIAVAHADDSLKQVVIAMTHYPHGAACVVDASGRLIGLVTDGDVRRALQAHDDIRGLRASAVMTANPSDHRAGCALAGSAAIDGRPAVADFGAAGGGSGQWRVPGPAAIARHIYRSGIGLARASQIDRVRRRSVQWLR